MIKFRAWDERQKIMHHDFQFVKSGDTGNDWIVFVSDKQSFSAENGRWYDNPYFSQQLKIMQWSGLQDKHGRDIYEGDLVRFREPYRSSQTHRGDNIPNGSYTEPMEPEIKTYVENVVLKNGIFKTDNEVHNGTPLSWCYRTYDEDEFKNAISCWGKDNVWNDPEDGELQYLLETYNLKDLNQLLDYVSGIEVIGNIYEQ